MTLIRQCRVQSHEGRSEMGVYNAQLKNKEENIMAIMMAFNEQVQEDVRRMEEFDNIMRNVKPLMTIGQGKNMKVITATSIDGYFACSVGNVSEKMRKKYIENQG